MKNRLTRQSLVVISLLMTGLYSHLATATWYVNQSEGYYKPQEYYNDKFGDFPPANIDQTLMRDAGKTPPPQATKPPAPTNNIESAPVNQPPPRMAPNARQAYQQPNYNNYNQQNNNQRNYNSRGYGSNYPGGNMPMGNQGFNFDGPWNNQGNNQGNNRGNNFNGPWNSGNSFSNPMNNNGSSFSFPWGNNSGSGFSPWGNNNGWRR